METYQIYVHTSGRYLTGGTLCAVNIKITGEEGGSTRWEQLGKSRLFQSNLKRGSVEVMRIDHEGEHVGPPLILSLKLNKRWFDSWLCEKVVVVYKETEYEFPIYDWIDENEMKVVQGHAELPQNVGSPLVRTMRQKEILENRSKFAWYPAPTDEDDVAWGVNRFVNAKNFLELPKIFLRTFNHMKNIGRSGFSVAVNTCTNVLRDLFNSIKSLDDYKKLYKDLGHKDPVFIDDWMKDEEMGRQVLNGISPLAFERCTSLPKYSDITEDDVRGLIPACTTLDAEQQAGRIYIADYTYAKNIERNKNPKTGEFLVCADCHALFHVTEDKKFVPIAIQLVPGDRSSVYTPKDEHYDWLLAKMYFRSTMSTMHEWYHHYLSTHAMSETFCIATFRCLPRSHPVYKLLRPHLITVPTINTDARFVIMPRGSLANRCNSLNSLSTLRECYKWFNISQLDVPAELKRKGTDDPSLLPNYHYRDDAMLIWEALEKFVTKVLNSYYKFNQEVQDDWELQAWLHDMAHEGFGWQDGNLRGVPDKIADVEQLVHLCTIIIFTSSAQHASVNFGQMESYQFVPNSPGCMRLPVHKKGEGSLDRIIASLPDVTTSSLFISFSYSLSHFNEDEVYFGCFPDRLFSEKAITNFQKDFLDDLDVIGQTITLRNEKLKFPYMFLLPKKIPSSIAI